MKDVAILKDIQEDAVEFEKKVRAKAQPLLKSGNDKLVEKVNNLLTMVNAPVRDFFESLDPDWTAEDKKKQLKDIGEKGLKESPKDSPIK